MDEEGLLIVYVKGVKIPALQWQCPKCNGFFRETDERLLQYIVGSGQIQEWVCKCGQRCSLMVRKIIT